MKFELYSVIGQSDGAGFALAYLLLDNTKKNDGIRTYILTEFFNQLKNRGLKYLQFFLTDKDFSQITAAQSTWNNIKIQLCLWHIKKALKKKLADNTPPKTTNYSSYSAHETFNFIDIEFYPSISDQKKERNFIFCPKDLRPKIIELLENHLHRHPLIPNCAGQFLSKEDIWKSSVQEIYEFCFKYDLRHVWAYLWTNWYQKKLWILWCRAAIEDQFCIFRTTMLMESHWKVIKRDFLPKFFRPRIDLLIYIIISRLIPHHQQQYQKYLNEREYVSWKKDFKKEWKQLEKTKINNFYLTDTTRWICGCLSFACNRFLICKHLVQQYGRPESFHNIYRQGKYPFLTFKENKENINELNTALENNNIQKGMYFNYIINYIDIN